MGVRVSGARLASAVANAGGIGLVASAGLAVNSPHYNGRNYFTADPLALKDELERARELARLAQQQESAFLTALEVLDDPIINRNFTWEFWFILAAILLLGSIAAAIGRGEGGGYD